MSLRNTWYASYGPYLYEDSIVYYDGKPLEGGRTPQACIEDTPSLYYHIVRKSELDSVVVSQGERLSIVESKLTSGGW